MNKIINLVVSISDRQEYNHFSRRLTLLNMCLLFIYIFTISLSAELVIINPKEPDSVTINIIDDQADYTIIEFLVNHYVREIVEIDSIEYNIIHLPNEGKRYEIGNPDLPLSIRSVAIPYQGKMKAEVLDSY